MFCLSIGSFFRSLFTIDGAEANSALSTVPYIVTAIALGVLLAAVYFIIWRGIEAKIVKRLFDADATSAADAKSLTEIGIGEKSGKIIRFLLRSHSAMIYKNVSCDELDKVNLDYMRAIGAVSTPKEETSGTTEDAANAEEMTTDATVDDTKTSDAVSEKPAKKTKKPRPKLRMKIPPDTKFYILPTRLSYVEEHALKFSRDDYWGLLYTSLGVVILWFLVMLLLDPLIGLFL